MIARIILLLIIILNITCGKGVTETKSSGDASQSAPHALSEIFDEIDKDIMNVKAWMEQAKTTEMGQYKIYGPNDINDTGLMVIGPTPKNLAIISDNKIGIVTGVGIIDIEDRDGNGNYETIIYNTIGSNGVITGRVYDWDRDGEPDQKLIFSRTNEISSKFLIRVSEQWLPISYNNGQAFITIDGKSIKLMVVGPGPKYAPVNMNPNKSQERTE